MTQADDSKSDWLNTVAHDLRTPINYVRGCIELVQQLGPLNERQQQFAEKAVNGLMRMDHLVARLLDLSWIDAGMELAFTECDLRVIVHDAVDMLHDVADAGQIQIHTDVDAAPNRVAADPQWLAQAIDNLVSNAIKYNREGGHVWIQARAEADRVLVSVRDTGIGISPQDQPRVFERFFRSREGVARRIEGSGLGLAITQAIIWKHGGRIWLESRVGEGTTFFFTLPFDRNESMADVLPEEGEDETIPAPPVTQHRSQHQDSVDKISSESKERGRGDSPGGDKP